MAKLENKPIFRELNADDPEPEVTEIESLCMRCYESGTTKLLLTKIPYYKEVIIASFSCDKCGYENNEIQAGGAIAEKELDFEIPANSQKGEITTVEGVIARSIAGLEQDQEIRKVQHPDAAKQISEFVKKLEKLKSLESPFTLILDDISGNSHIENPNAPQKDSKCIIQNYVRTTKQNHALCIFNKDELSTEEGILQPITENEFPLNNFENEVLQFPTNCNNCGASCKTNMKVTNIPHFKEVIIMATNCDSCGNRTNEVKSGSGIEPHGIRIEVEVRSKEDFSRDLLKSETCSLSIPQLDLEVGPWALGGRFTTIEGILIAVKEQLSDPRCSHMVGDSQDPEKKIKLENFIQKFDEILEGRKIITVILDDPAGNSYIQSLSDDDKADDALKIIHYERNFEQNEELGLNDMKVENYETS
ncbi:putative zinc ion binding protein [Trypoxylus dichotomus]